MDVQKPRTTERYFVFAKSHMIIHKLISDVMAAQIGFMDAALEF